MCWENTCLFIFPGIPFCYTDGNATKAISKFYNTLYGLKELDWNCIRAKIWKNTDDDFDRVRKKMSEFLVKGHLPNSLIRGFLVKNEDARMRIAAIIGDSLPNCKVTVDTDCDFYYRGI